MGSIIATVKRSRGIAAALGAMSVAALTGEQMRRIFRAREHGRQAPPAFSHMPPLSRRRVLVVGDSTGAGVGCESPADSIAGRIARDFAQVEIDNVAVSGATVAEVARQVQDLPADRPPDLVLVFAGGNDVLRRTPQAALRRSVRDLLEPLHSRGATVIWVGMANVGLAPAFLPPLSWWLTYRTRRVKQLLADEVARCGAHFVDFFHERAADPFSAAADCYYADDGVHPSAWAYGYCYHVMKPLISAALGSAPQPGGARPHDPPATARHEARAPAASGGP